MAKGQQLKHFYQSFAKQDERGDSNELYLLPLQPISDNSNQYFNIFTKYLRERGREIHLFTFCPKDNSNARYISIFL